MIWLKDGMVVNYDERDKVIAALSGNSPKKIEQQNANEEEN